jgi:hypothetical protein
MPTASRSAGTGWRDEVKIKPPPGIDYCDRLMDRQDALDRAELAKRLAGAGVPPDDAA